MKQLVLILSVLLLPLIISIKPQVEAGEMIIHVLVEVGSVKAQGARPHVVLGQRGGIVLLLKGNSVGTTREIRTSLKASTTRTNIAITNDQLPH